MVDHVSVEKRSQIMRAVRAKHTGPELLVRSASQRLGLRFRLHDRSLPGSPDLVFKSKRTVLFVNGCYWHRHQNCPKATVPKSNRRFWTNKFAHNVERDERNYSKLRRAGWRTVLIWQCEVKNIRNALRVVAREMGVSQKILRNALERLS